MAPTPRNQRLQKLQDLCPKVLEGVLSTHVTWHKRTSVLKLIEIYWGTIPWRPWSYFLKSKGSLRSRFWETHRGNMHRKTLTPRLRTWQPHHTSSSIGLAKWVLFCSVNYNASEYILRIRRCFPIWRQVSSEHLKASLSWKTPAESNRLSNHTSRTNIPSF